jgi:hypothetical protein
MKYENIVIDFETLGETPSSKVIDLAACVFNFDVLDDFNQLVESDCRTFYVKFDLSKQTARIATKSTLQWWSTQPKEVQAALHPTEEDMSIKEGLLAFSEFCKEHGIGPKSHMFTRGTSFDASLLSDLVAKECPELSDGYGNFPVKFWNVDDIRTALRFMLLMPNLMKCPVKKGLLEGFIKHNSIHDVCKDVILLQHSYKVAKGNIELDNNDIELI